MGATVNISFKEYVDSKTALLEAVKQTPITRVEYEIRNYCTLSVGEAVEEATTFSLKPKQTVIIEWECSDLDRPEPRNVTVDARGTAQEYKVHWSGTKLHKWLLRHAREGKNCYGTKA